MIHAMKPVTLADVFFDAQRGEAWMLLADPTGRRGLPTFIGSWSPAMISALRPTALQAYTPRPLTFEFMANVLGAVGADLDAVQITEDSNRTFHAVACLRAGEQEHRIDARPSDAVGLAACMNRPVYVAEELMEQAGKPLDPEGRPHDVPASFQSTRRMWANKPGPQGL
jgi:uncharacterized protein